MRLISGTYVVEVTKHARWIKLEVNVTDHKCGQPVFRRFLTRYFGICQFVLNGIAVLGTPPAPNVPLPSRLQAPFAGGGDGSGL